LAAVPEDKFEAAVTVARVRNDVPKLCVEDTPFPNRHNSYIRGMNEHHESYLNKIANWDTDPIIRKTGRTAISFIVVGALVFAPETIPLGVFAAGTSTLGNAYFVANPMGDAPIKVPIWPSHSIEQRPNGNTASVVTEDA
jgi:hypothetical protein